MAYHESQEMPIAVDSSSSSCLSDSTEVFDREDIRLDNDEHRLALLKQFPYRDYCDAFLSELCSSDIGAHAIASGKVALNQTKTQKGMSYGVGAVCAGTSLFGPTGLIHKAADDGAGYIIGKKRTEGFVRTTQLAPDPVRFVFFAQALTYCLVFCFKPGWADDFRTAKAAEKSGKRAAHKLMSTIRHEEKEALYSKETPLAKRLRGCVDYLAKILVKDQVIPKEEGIDTKPETWWEWVLLLGTVGVLGIPITYFEEVENEIKPRLLALERKLNEEITQAQLQASTKKPAMNISFAGKQSKVRGGIYRDNTLKGVQVSAQGTKEELENRAEFVTKIIQSFDSFTLSLVSEQARIQDAIVERMVGIGIDATQGDNESSSTSQQQYSPSRCSSSLHGRSLSPRLTLEAQERLLNQAKTLTASIHANYKAKRNQKLKALDEEYPLPLNRDKESELERHIQTLERQQEQLSKGAAVTLT